MERRPVIAATAALALAGAPGCWRFVPGSRGMAIDRIDPGHGEAPIALDVDLRQPAGEGSHRVRISVRNAGEADQYVVSPYRLGALSADGRVLLFAREAVASAVWPVEPATDPPGAGRRFSLDWQSALPVGAFLEPDETHTSELAMAVLVPETPDLPGGRYRFESHATVVERPFTADARHRDVPCTFGLRV